MPKAYLLHSGAGDWVGLYDESGNLLDEGGSLAVSEVLRLLGYEVDEVTGGEYLEEYDSHCPQTWAEVSGS